MYVYCAYLPIVPVMPEMLLLLTILAILTQTISDGKKDDVERVPGVIMNQPKT